MLLKVSGVVVLIIGLALVTSACYGFYGADNVRQTLASAMSSKGLGFDEGKWALHYHAYLAAWFVAAMFSILGGLLMLSKRVMGLACFAIGISIILIYPVILKIFGINTYQLESVNYPTVAILVGLLCITLWEIYYYLRRPARR
jgi:uncharacterized membrane protein YhdT